MILFIEFFAWIAQLIFGFVSKIIILIIDLANYPFFSIDTIKEFTNKVFMVIGTKPEIRILEDDIVTVYGTAAGLYKYQTVMGSTLTIPEILFSNIVIN